MTIYQIIFRSLLAVLLGGLIGTERAKHGRAAGMRTHILVCLGSALTSMTGVFVNQAFGGGDVLRISAQVISGIGFLGAGMIIIKNNDIITGLTTAAGVWATSIIGIALGYGFYSGAILCTIFFLAAVIFFSKLEKRRRPAETVYVEISDLYKTNDVVDAVTEMLDGDLTYTIVPAKSGTNGHVGLIIILGQAVEISKFRAIDAVAFVTEE
jgi:putative Mg2+ transporter-C (MgtC) family protein